MRYVLPALLIFISTVNARADEFLLKDGERVVFLGNTLVEREQEYGDWELQLTLAAGEKKVTFRNLGWSGDTVWAESRGLFDPPAVGYQRTQELIKELKPTTILVGYGTVESFRGPSGLEAFITQYKKLRQDLLASSSDARLVHLSPILLEAEMFPPLAEGVDEHVLTANQNMNQYADAVRQIASEFGELFVDFRPEQRNVQGTQPWTENGLHLSAQGYQSSSTVLVRELGGAVQSGDFGEIRELIRRKNEFFFHRWRPQNFTYLLGFRKHEQGQNAVEIAQFVPFIQDIEAQIQQLKTK